MARKKFNVGDKVHYTESGWSADDKYTVNAVVVSVNYVKGQQEEGSLKAFTGYVYSVRPTKQSVNQLYDVDREELQMMRDNPMNTYFKGSHLTRGHVRNPGYK